MDKKDKPCVSCANQEQCFGLVCSCGYRHWGTPMMKDNLEEFEGYHELFEPRSPDWCALYTPVRRGNRL